MWQNYDMALCIVVSLIPPEHHCRHLRFSYLVEILAKLVIQYYYDSSIKHRLWISCYKHFTSYKFIMRNQFCHMVCLVEVAFQKLHLVHWNQTLSSFVAEHKRMPWRSNRAASFLLTPVFSILRLPLLFFTDVL